LPALPVQPNPAIGGATASAHEAGIHQDGMLKNASTYEIMTPESVGVPENRIVLGKHSGRHALAARLRRLGYRLTHDELEAAYEGMTAVADRKKTIDDSDLREIVNDIKVRQSTAAGQA
jgi:2-isopropylmalate synthase